MAETNLNDQMKQLRADFAALQSDVAELANLLRDIGAERVEEAKGSAAEKLRERRAELERQLRTARTRGKETIDELEETISGYPFGSLAVAFGVGFLIAKIMDLGGRR